MEQAAEIGLSVDKLLLNCSGGGLVSGAATAIKGISDRTEVYSVEPAGFDDMARSLKTGRPAVNEPGKDSICDALLIPTPGKLTLAICKELLSGGLV